MDEKSDEEGARTLGIPVGTYKSRLRKAQNLIRERLRAIAGPGDWGTGNADGKRARCLQRAGGLSSPVAVDSSASRR